MAGEFDFHELLAGPILAANAAQADVALGFVEQLQQIAFEPRSAKDAAADAGPQKLRELSFAAPGGLDAEGRPLQQEISVPLLQLVPLSSLLIDTATIEFDCDVAAAKPVARPAAQKVAQILPERQAALAPRLLGRIAPTSGSESLGKGNLRVHMHLKRTDLPAGYLDMIAATHSTARQMPAAAESVAQPGLISAQIARPAKIDFMPGREVSFEVLVTRISPDDAGLIELTLESGAPARFAVIEPAVPVQLTARENRIRVVAYVRKEFERSRETATAPIMLTAEQRPANASAITTRTVLNVPLSSRSKS